MKAKVSISLHHGSPGSSQDFFHLNQLMPECNMIANDRVDSSSTVNVNDVRIQLGYSFGCVHALKAAAKNPDTENVILIAPFLFPQKKPGVMMKSLLNVKLFKNKLLPTLAKKSIHSMLVQSSHPHPVPEKYKLDSKIYLNPNRLKYSIIEKDIIQTEIFNYLKILEERNVKVYMIAGEQDLTSSKELQLDPLKNFKNIKIDIIPKAGHALLWTHTDACALKIKEILKEKNNAQTSARLGYFPGADERNNVASFMQKHLENFPNKKILTWIDPLDAEKIKQWKGELDFPINHQSVTVAELDHLVAILAHEFKNQGIAFGDRVILFLPMSLYMYASMFALQKMGAIPTFLDSWARRDQMGASAKVATPSAMISSDRAFGYLIGV